MSHNKCTGTGLPTFTKRKINALVRRYRTFSPVNYTNDVHKVLKSMVNVTRTHRLKGGKTRV